MRKRWGFWTFWVGINALASFVWGIALSINTLASLSAMVLGVGCFIVFYTLIDDFARKKSWHQFTTSLQKGVFIKAGLQLLNLAIPISPFIAPEVWAGIGGLHISEIFWSDNTQPFLFTFTATLITGAILTLFVAAISLLISLISKPKKIEVTTQNFN